MGDRRRRIPHWLYFSGGDVDPLGDTFLAALPLSVMVSLPQRRALLVAALGFMRLRWREPVPAAVLMLARWMNTWSGVGAVARGMTAQSFNVELKEFPNGWRANFYAVGTAHSVALGSAYEPTAWAAVQEAGWAALQEPRAPGA